MVQNSAVTKLRIPGTDAQYVVPASTCPIPLYGTEKRIYIGLCMACPVLRVYVPLQSYSMSGTRAALVRYGRIAVPEQLEEYMLKGARASAEVSP
eukprot:3936004-Rhodomonas_salina.1